MLTRRALLAGVALAAFRNDTISLVERLVTFAPTHPEEAAQDEAFWMQIQEAFALDRSVANFNNGGVCPSPRVVQEAMRRQLEFANQAPSYYMWRILEPEIEHVRHRLAAAFGCDPEEMAITRNASEALENALFGFELQRGDEVLTTNLDYPRMISTIRQRERREGIKMVQVRLPTHPSTMNELSEPILRAIGPKTKLILISHVSFMNGQIFPVRAIVDGARQRGIPVVVDGAHAFAQFPFNRDGLGCDYYGVSLHKWLMAPIGTGFLYVRKEKISSLWSLMASSAEQAGDIRKFEEIGTHPAANHNAIAEALTFHELIGPERKAARLRLLRQRWVDRIADRSNVRFNTNLEPDFSCGITNVEIVGIDPGKLAGWLLDKHGIFVTTVAGEDFQGIRVTPNVYTTFSEIDRFAKAMAIASESGIG